MLVLTIKLLISELFNRSVSSTYHKPIRDGPLEIVWVGEGAGGGAGEGQKIFMQGKINTKLRKKLGPNSVPQNNPNEQFEATLTQSHAETRLDYQSLFTKITPCLPAKVSFR